MWTHPKVQRSVNGCNCRTKLRDIKVTRKVVPSWAPLSPPLWPLIPCSSVVRKVSGQGSNRGPNWENPGWVPQIDHSRVFFFFSSNTGCPQLPSAMAARAGELRARARWGFGFKVLCGYCLCQWLLAIDDWLLAIWPCPWLLVIGYWYLH
jgi:hypothetical protein